MKIFIADYLPLKNKGEEEIVKGIEALYQKKTNDKKITFCLFDEVSDLVIKDNFRIYPRSVVYSDFRHRRRLSKFDIIKNIVKTIVALLGGGKFFQICEFNSLYEDLKSADIVLLGHDGFFNIECAYLSLFLNRKNIKYAMLGSGFAVPNRKIKFFYDLVNKKCFDNSEFIILREETAFKYVKSISCNSKVYIYPDPAFFCKTESSEVVLNLIEKYGLESSISKIGFTICENSISFSGAFVDSQNKSNDHRIFISMIIDRLIEQFGVNIYFFPHCIENGIGNDISIAHSIKSKSLYKENIIIIEEDLPVLQLKSLISKMDFFVGERTHSIINCINLCVPFVNLTCSTDFRTHDIVGRGCGLEDLIINLDYPNLENVYQKVSVSYESKSDIENRLKSVKKKHDDIENNLIKTI